jgi:hypothetical protein
MLGRDLRLAAVGQKQRDDTPLGFQPGRTVRIR